MLRAYTRAIHNLTNDKSANASAVSAGFSVDETKPKGEREGYQVFVKVIRFSEKRLAKHPESGGLSENP